MGKRRRTAHELDDHPMWRFASFSAHTVLSRDRDPPSADQTCPHPFDTTAGLLDATMALKGSDPQARAGCWRFDAPLYPEIRWQTDSARCCSSWVFGRSGWRADPIGASGRALGHLRGARPPARVNHPFSPGHGIRDEATVEHLGSFRYFGARQLAVPVLHRRDVRTLAMYPLPERTRSRQELLRRTPASWSLSRIGDLAPERGRAVRGLTAGGR